MNGLSSAVKVIKKSKTIAVACHINPDGDTIGSMLSLSRGLEKMGKRVITVSSAEIPQQYRVLPGAISVKKTLKDKIDLAITVDCNSAEMVGPVLKNLRKNSKSVLAIDHHRIREPFEDLAFIDLAAAAVGEMVYVLLQKLKVKIDRDIARSILTSIIVETNSFRLPSVRVETFEICAKLVRTGLDFKKLVENVFWKKNARAVVLSGLCMSRCKFRSGGRMAWTMVRKRDFLSTRGKDQDLDAIPDEIRAINGVDVTVFLREQAGGKLRVSLRSKKDINVGKLAKEYGGGGHSDVAGCVINNSTKEIKRILQDVQRLLK
jgi:bifunctional oligoribonuclease and PAP phosphatase NrnA